MRNGFFGGLMKNPRSMGIVGTIGVVLLGLLVLLLSTVSFGKRDVTAVFDHSAGLRAGEEVQVAGVGVGDVKKVELTDDRSAVKVTFTMDKDIALGDTSRATIKVATLLGTHYLDIEPSGTGRIDAIKLQNTSVPYNLQDVIEGTQGTLDELDQDELAEAMNVVTEVLQKTPDETRAAIDGVSALSKAAAARTEQIRSLLSASETVTASLNANRAKIFDLMEQSTLVLNELTTRRKAIDAMLADTRALAAQVNGILKDTENDLQPLMDNLTAALDHLESTKDTVYHAFIELSYMTKFVANATGNGPWLDVNLYSLLPEGVDPGGIFG